MEPNIPGSSTSSRATRFMMEGVGARVIRGPDWKWGKQVDHCLFLLYTIFFNIFHEKRNNIWFCWKSTNCFCQFLQKKSDIPISFLNNFH